MIHPLIVHLPIGILLLNVVLVFLTRLGKYAAAKTILPITLGLGCLSAIAACITGYWLSQNGGYDDAILQKHQWLGIGVAVLSAAILVFKKQESRLATLALAALLSVAGHYGGALTHGENYLLAAPNTSNTEGGVFDKQAAQKEEPVIENIQKALVYNDLVRPILKEKCYACHNAVKQKGKLRLDETAAILRGGENGAVIIAGQAEQSPMIKRLLLELKHKEHMPPKGKPQPTTQEIDLLKWWITEGVSFDKKIEELPQTEAIKSILATYQKGSMATNLIAENRMLPIGTVGKADEKVIADLQKQGIVVLPIAPNSPFLSVSFISKPEATDSAVEKLKPITGQIAWLKLSGTKISDITLQTVGQMPNLTRLYLNDTPISDSGLTALENLNQLQYLNLVGTKVGLQGLNPLSKLPYLKQLFVFKTGVSWKDSADLRTLLPKVQIDLGGYQVPTFASDTTVLKAKK